MPPREIRESNMLWVVSHRESQQFVAAFRTRRRAQEWVDDTVPIGPNFQYDVRMSWIIE